MKHQKSPLLPKITFVSSSSDLIPTPKASQANITMAKSQHRYLLARDMNLQQLAMIESNINLHSVNAISKYEFISNHQPTRSQEPSFVEHTPREMFFPSGDPSFDPKISSIQAVLTPIHSTLSLPQIQTKNIFKDPQAIMMCQHDPQAGPRFNAKNKIISHSLVGKPEWYMKTQTQDKPDYPKATQGKNRKREEEDSKSTITLRQQKRMTTKNITSMKVIPQNERLLNTKEVKDLIADIEQRISNNRKSEETKLTKLGYQRRQGIENDMRVIKRHNENETVWNEFILNSSMRLKRDPEDSQLLDVYDYRRKKEYMIANDMLHDRFDNKYMKFWQMKVKEDEDQLYSTDRLLKKESVSIPLLLVELQSTNVQGKPLDEPVLNNVAIVRKATNNLGDNVDESQNSTILQSLISDTNNDRAFNSFTTQRYLEDRYNQYNSEATKFNQVKDRIVVQPDNLVVVGKSQLKFETAGIKRESFGFYRVPIKNPITIQEPEAVIESEYDFRNHHRRLD